MIWDSAVSRFVTDTATISSTFMSSGSDGAAIKADLRSVLENDFEMQLERLPMPGFPSSSVGTNIGGALRLAARTLAVQGRRRASVWMILLLSDGAPNATNRGDGLWAPTTFSEGFCPPKTWPKPDAGTVYTATVPGYTAVYTTGEPPYSEPLCLRLNGSYAGATWVPFPYAGIQRVCARVYTDTMNCGPGTTIMSSGLTDSSFLYRYDAADFARDQADYMSKNGIIAFVIGLGPYVSGEGVTINQLLTIPSMTLSGPEREPNSGERLLRYIADVGYEPDVKLEEKTNWPCHSNYWSGATELPVTQQCGNYWYAATGDGLKRVFEEISSRMFTRLK